MLSIPQLTAILEAMDDNTAVEISETGETILVATSCPCKPPSAFNYIILQYFAGNPRIQANNLNLQKFDPSWFVSLKANMNSEDYLIDSWDFNNNKLQQGQVIDIFEAFKTTFQTSVFNFSGPNMPFFNANYLPWYQFCSAAGKEILWHCQRGTARLSSIDKVANFADCALTNPLETDMLTEVRDEIFHNQITEGWEINMAGNCQPPNSTTRFHIAELQALHANVIYNPSTVPVE